MQSLCEMKEKKPLEGLCYELIYHFTEYGQHAVKFGSTQRKDVLQQVEKHRDEVHKIVNKIMDREWKK